ncbi:universal stress protein [Halorarius litoreus]|uniref:universal stress protein n=1 Tax=Halorarius litoreus TaxID=2962676 RepID=UPI0020CDAD3D|nr:universal stress protein [Halorarius litoreus]
MAEFDHLLVPVASEKDATATARALRAHLDHRPERITLVYVVEKAGGAADKASVEQREAAAAETFDAFREAFEDGDALAVDTDIAYDTDVADGILAVARDVSADAVAFTPRGGGLFARLLTGDVTRDLIDRADRPVLALPGER